MLETNGNVWGFFLLLEAKLDFLRKHVDKEIFFVDFVHQTENGKIKEAMAFKELI